MRWILFVFVVYTIISATPFVDPEIGKVIDSYKGVSIYYNGNNFSRVEGRNIGPDGYNFGLKYQCVEFVKRFYYQAKNHKMPNTYGHAKDLFDKSLPDSAFNSKRGLTQFRNVREYKPQVDDLLIYDGYPGNKFGHVAIISKVGDDYVELVQQNMGKESRKRINLVYFEPYWTVADYHVLGWLRK
jgi:hypothetical protein